MGIDGLVVKTLNVSWEANNADPSAGFRPTRSRKMDKRPGSWKQAIAVWEAYGSDVASETVGPAYAQSIEHLLFDRPDVALVQEYQWYFNETTKEHSADLLKRRGYTIVAKEQTSDQPPAATLVLVRDDILVASTDRSEAVRSRPGVFFPPLPFPQGKRPVAVAHVVLNRRGAMAEYLLVSSHGSPKFTWSTSSVNMQAAEFQNLMNAPEDLVWAGDFNAPPAEASAPLTTVPPLAATHELGKIDWMVTTAAGAVSVDPERLAPSDHKLVKFVLH